MVKRAPAMSMPAASAARHKVTAELGNAHRCGVSPAVRVSLIQRATRSGASRGTYSSLGNGTPVSRLAQVTARTLHRYRGCNPRRAGSTCENHAAARWPQAEYQSMGADAGRAPHRIAPPGAPLRVEGEVEVHRSIAQAGQVEGQTRGRSTAAAGQPPEVRSGQSVPEADRTGVDGQGSPDHRASPLELVYREVHALAEQCLEGGLDPVPAHEALQVAVLATGPLQQRSVGARPVGEDRAPRQGEEISLARLQPLPEDRPRLDQREGIPEVGREAAHQTGAHGQVVQQDPREHVSQPATAPVAHWRDPARLLEALPRQASGGIQTQDEAIAVQSHRSRVVGADLGGRMLPWTWCVTVAWRSFTPYRPK